MNKTILEDLENICKNDIFECEGKNFLITGANGFFASYIIYVLFYLNKNFFKKKCSIYALVRNRNTSLIKFEDFNEEEYFHIIEADVCSPIHISADIHYIIHAASYASPQYYLSNPIEVFKPNIIGTYNMLELAKDKKADAFLFISSGEVYGNTEEIPTSEAYVGKIDPLELRSCYAESKKASEMMCTSYFHQYGVNSKIARLFHTYGPGIVKDDQRVFSDFVRNIVNEESLILKSSGSAIRTFCYISDAITGMFYILFKGSPGAAYNLSNPKCAVSIRELALLLAKEYALDASFGKSSPEYSQSKISRNIPDISKIKTLGWQPEVDLLEGFSRTVQWARKEW